MDIYIQGGAWERALRIFLRGLHQPEGCRRHAGDETLHLSVVRRSVLTALRRGKRNLPRVVTDRSSTSSTNSTGTNSTGTNSTGTSSDRRDHDHEPPLPAPLLPASPRRGSGALASRALMKLRDLSRLLHRTKAPRAPKLQKKPKERLAGSFRDKLDWRWLCGWIGYRGVASGDVEDIAQEVLLVVARVTASPPPPLKPGQTRQQQRRALLKRIARFRVWSYFRDRRRRATEPREDIETIAVTPAIAEDALDEKARREMLDEGLAHLAEKAPELHAMVQAHDLEERPMPAILAELSVPMRLGTAWSCLTRGRRELRAFSRRYQARQQLRHRKSTSC